MAQRVKGSPHSPRDSRGQRRPRRPREVEPAGRPEAPISLREALRSIAVLSALLAVTVGLGIAMGAAVRPEPSGAFSNCHTARAIAPRTYVAPPAMCTDPRKNYTATILTTKGNVGIVMPAGQAPVTRNNFIVLAVNGYYDGLRFWRSEDWVVQTGDPHDDGRGGPGYTLPEEPTKEGWQPGSLGMARPINGPLNGGQFFITRDNWPGDGPGSIVYNRFGSVVLGFDILTQLSAGDRVLRIEVKPG